MSRIEGPLRRYKLTLAYDGTCFHGWQRQEPPNEPALRTVQGVLEAALCRLLGQRIVTLGASRTDAGVHAAGQVVQFDAACRIPVERLCHAINSRLPEDVDVRAAEIVSDDFHVIRDVVSKQYRYRIFHADHRPLGLRNYVYHTRTALDVNRMNEAAARLVGAHDFAGFAAAGHGRSSTVRTIFRCEVVEGQTLSGQARTYTAGALRRGYEVIDIFVEGDGFLWNMVRIIAGTLVEVGRGGREGRGRFGPERLDEILAAGDRQLAGPTLEPQGLELRWIRYAGDQSERNLATDEHG